MRGCGGEGKKRDQGDVLPAGASKQGKARASKCAIPPKKEGRDPKKSSRSGVLSPHFSSPSPSLLLLHLFSSFILALHPPLLLPLLLLLLLHPLLSTPSSPLPDPTACLPKAPIRPFVSSHPPFFSLHTNRIRLHLLPLIHHQHHGQLHRKRLWILHVGHQKCPGEGVSAIVAGSPKGWMIVLPCP